MARESLQQQQTDHQSVMESLHQQLRDGATQLSASAANVDRLTASLSLQTDRADDLQTRLDHTDAQLRTKVEDLSALYVTVIVVIK